MRRHYLIGSGQILCVVTALVVAARLAGAQNVPPEDLADQDITMAVMMELAGEHPAAYEDVQVMTKDGIVTLTGRVPHLLARQRAAAIVQSFKGVKAVVNRLEVELEPRPEAELRDDVLAALAAEPATADAGIDVDVQDGVVTVGGAVGSHVERVLALQTARGVRGVRRVVNRLALHESEERPDEEIAADVRSRLKWDVWVDESGIEASAEDGVVTLTGVAGSVAEQFRARVNAWVAGVKDVKDELRVESRVRKELRREQRVEAINYEDVRRRVAAAIEADPRVNGQDIQIGVKAGEVTLLGYVGSLAARRAAEEDARNTVGVALVDNQLAVRPAEGVSNTELTHAVGRALTRDPYVARYEIGVSVVGGAATLTGTVSSRFDRQRAAAIAGTVRGVTQVPNEIKVDAQEELSDEDLAGRIRRRLEWSPYLRSGQFQVSVKEGVATLSGEADRPAQAHVAVQIARQAGAQKVVNEIDVVEAAEPNLR